MDADALERAGRYREAAQALRRELESLGSPYRQEPTRTHAALWHRLGTLLGVRLARFAEGEELLLRALAARRGNELEEAETMAELAGTYRLLGKHADSAQLFEGALAIVERRVGKQQPEWAWLAMRASALHRDQQRFEVATALSHAALTVFERRVPRDDPRFIEALKIEAYRAMLEGLHVTAARNAGRALDVLRSRRARHPSEAGALLILARIAPARVAAGLAADALAIYEATFGDHPLTAIALGRLTYARLRLGDHDSLVEDARRALRIYETTFGVEHRYVRTFAETLAWAEAQVAGRQA